MNVDTEFRNVANSLTAQGMTADIAAQNAERQMKAQGMSADIAAQNANRWLESNNLKMGYEFMNVSNQLQAQGMSADIAAGNAARQLQAQGMSADVAANNYARALQASGMSAEESRANADRWLQTQVQQEEAGFRRAQLGADLNQMLSEQNLAYQQQAAQQLATSMGFQPQLTGLQMLPMDLYGQVGAQQQAQQQQAINEAMARWQYAVDQPWMNIERGAALAGMTPLAAQMPSQPSTNPFMATLGGLSIAGGLAKPLGITMAANPSSLPLLLAGGAGLGYLSSL
jgi:hypothetical protein